MRRSRSRTERARLFALFGGVCYLCGGRIDATREKWDVEHVIPLSLGGSDDDDNLSLAHKKCHAPKTKDDMAALGKARRREAIHNGYKPPSRQKIQSAGFPQRERRKPATSPVGKLYEFMGTKE